MIDRETIQSAKDVDINIILDEFGWEKNKYGQIRCPHPSHDDKTASCSYSVSRNTCKCFGCGEVFDTIDLYQCLCEKVNGRVVPFYRAVEEILKLEDMANGSNGSAMITNSSNQVNGYQSGSSKSCQVNGQPSKGNSGSPYEMIINNSKPISGYELNFLHSRGIMLYDSFVYRGKVYTEQSINKALRTTTDQNEINRLCEIKTSGTLYKGISAILTLNKIQIKHNYWEGTNSIIYLVDYEADECTFLCSDQFYMGTGRHMAIQKRLDGNHTKRALGTSDFNFITKDIQDKGKDIYLTEGIEDALTFAMNNKRSISLNSIANLKSLMHYLSEDYVPCHKDRFVICFDHDSAGRKATQEMKDFFENYNQNPSNRYKYSYAVCEYPKQFKDINDYWISRIFS